MKAIRRGKTGGGRIKRKKRANRKKRIRVTDRCMYLNVMKKAVMSIIK